jgi:DNA-binding NtrC family response regulator
LTHSFFQRYRPEHQIAINNQVLEILSNYGWPENVEQLQRVVGRMAVLSGTNRIDIDELRSLAPEVLQDDAHVSNRSGQTGKAQTVAAGQCVAKPLLDPSLSLQFHPGIQKALAYISKCYTQDLTLRKVAQHACLSCSHLCFLLKKDTGMSFKTILMMARIEKVQCGRIRDSRLRRRSPYASSVT